MSSKLATSNLSLRQLRAFVAVAQESSMTRAAARLHLTPSALSMLVRAMEDDLGVRLFERTTRRLVLTPAGQQFLPTVERVFAELEQGLNDLQAVQHMKDSVLRLVATPLLASALFPQLIASFRLLHPQVRVELLDGPVDSLPALVRQAQVDMAVCTANDDAFDVHATPLYADTLMLACHSAHPLAMQREVAWQDLLSEPLILMRHGSGLRTLVDQAFARWSRRIQPAYEVSQVATALGLVAAGEGVSVLPSYAISRVQSLSSTTTISTVALVSPTVSRQIVALTKSGVDASPAAQAFMAHFKMHAGKA
ncbi:LysR family transcriptional regulator [Limnohabitans sp.]|uniref:LysR family transcriptional regulator n=1 Tax=Limnohabitans sp. TaxID=1907725 RepID=UPI0038BB8091